MDNMIYLEIQPSLFLIPLFHYNCTGNLRSFVFIWTTAGATANFELCGSENSSKNVPLAKSSKKN